MKTTICKCFFNSQKKKLKFFLYYQPNRHGNGWGKWKGFFPIWNIFSFKVFFVHFDSFIHYLFCFNEKTKSTSNEYEYFHHQKCIVFFFVVKAKWMITWLKQNNMDPTTNNDRWMDGSFIYSICKLYTMFFSS